MSEEVHKKKEVRGGTKKKASGEGQIQERGETVAYLVRGWRVLKKKKRKKRKLWTPFYIEGQGGLAPRAASEGF
jgi:hypothetical protein